jgi:hypothetical protein
VARTVRISRRVAIVCVVVVAALFIVLALPGRLPWDAWRWSRVLVWTVSPGDRAIASPRGSSPDGSALFAGGQQSPVFELRGDRPVRLEWSSSPVDDGRDDEPVLGVTIDRVEPDGNPPYLRWTADGRTTTSVAASFRVEPESTSGGWDVVRDVGLLAGRPEPGRYAVRAIAQAPAGSPPVTFTAWERRGYLAGVAAEWWVLGVGAVAALVLLLRSRRRWRRSRPKLA